MTGADRIFKKSEMLEELFSDWDWQSAAEQTDLILRRYYPAQAKTSLLTAAELLREIRNSGAWKLFVFSMNELQTEKLFQSNIHGQGHIERVAILSCYLAGKRGLDREALEWCLEIAKYHDVGREDNSGDPLHGRRGAEKIPEICGRYPKKVRQLLAAVVEAHSLGDQEAPNVFSKYPDLSGEWLKHGRQLLEIVKDADALDRFRLTDHSLKAEYLRGEDSGGLLRAACEMVHMKQEAVKREEKR